jgi:hypothetical protein
MRQIALESGWTVHDWAKATPAVRSSEWDTLCVGSLSPNSPNLPAQSSRTVACSSFCV